MNNTQLVDEDFVQETLAITEQTRKANVPLRAMGACAIRIHCPNHLELHKVNMQRKITDLDFVTLRKYQTDVRDVVKQFGYAPDLAMIGMSRDVYRNAQKGIIMDVFFDRLEMCHTMKLENRLENDFPTISLADLILEKLQVVKINEKDIKDVIVLLLEHGVGESDENTIDMKYVAKLLASDWGFYHTVTMNLNKIRNMANNQYGSILLPEEIKTINSKVDDMLSRINQEPKSMKWRMRERLGPKKIWYREVEEVAMGSVTEYLMKKYEKERA